MYVFDSLLVTGRSWSIYGHTVSNWESVFYWSESSRCAFLYVTLYRRLPLLYTLTGRNPMALFRTLTVLMDCITCRSVVGSVGIRQTLSNLLCTKIIW